MWLPDDLWLRWVAHARSQGKDKQWAQEQLLSLQKRLREQFTAAQIETWRLDNPLMSEDARQVLCNQIWQLRATRDAGGKKGGR